MILTKKLRSEIAMQYIDVFDGKPIVTCANCKHVVCAEYINEESIEISHRYVWFQFFLTEICCRGMK